MIRLPAPVAAIRARHLRCVARADDPDWCPEHEFPNQPDHCVACRTSWPCDVERMADAVADVVQEIWGPRRTDVPGDAAEIRALASDTRDALVQVAEGTMGVPEANDAIGVLVELAGLEGALRRAQERLARTVAAEPEPPGVPEPLVFGEAAIRALGALHVPGDGRDGPCDACGSMWPCDTSKAAGFGAALADAIAEWRRTVQLVADARGDAGSAPHEGSQDQG